MFIGLLLWNRIFVHNYKIILRHTVKSFNFVGTKFHSLMTMDMFVDTWIHGFQIILNITKVNKYFIGILNLCIPLPKKYRNLNVQWIKMISQYLVITLKVTYMSLTEIFINVIFFFLDGPWQKATGHAWSASLNWYGTWCNRRETESQIQTSPYLSKSGFTAMLG